MKSTRKTINVNPPLFNALQAISEVKSTTPTAIVDELIKEYILENLTVITADYAALKPADDKGKKDG